MRRFAALFALALLGCKKTAPPPSEQGAQLFAATCARCHGADGAGGQPLWEAGPAPRNFHDHAFQNERTDEQLKQTIKSGKGIGMPAFGTTFDDAQIDSLVARVRSFDGGETK